MLCIYGSVRRESCKNVDATARHAVAHAFALRIHRRISRQRPLGKMPLQEHEERPSVSATRSWKYRSPFARLSPLASRSPGAVVSGTELDPEIIKPTETWNSPQSRYSNSNIPSSVSLMDALAFTHGRQSRNHCLILSPTKEAMSSGGGHGRCARARPNRWVSRRCRPVGRSCHSPLR